VAIFINFYFRARPGEHRGKRMNVWICRRRERINKEEHAAIYEAIAAKDIDGAPRKACGGTSAKAMERLGLVKS